NAANPFLTRLNTEAITFGSTQTISSQIANEFRFNYSRSSGHSDALVDNFGGAVPLPDTALFPPFATRQDSQFFLCVIGECWEVGIFADNHQRQVNVVDNLSIASGAHQVKFGGDYRRLSPIFHTYKYNPNIFFETASDVLESKASVSIFASVGPRYLLF